MNQIGTLRQHHDKYSLKYIYEAVRTIIEVKLLELEEFYKKKFFYHINKIAKISTMRAIIGVLPKIIFEATLIGIIFFLIYYYTSEKLPLDNLLSQLIIYSTAAFRIMPSLNLIPTVIRGLSLVIQPLNYLKMPSHQLKKIYSQR